ncbi:MAG TPA: hypothetical protein VLE53_08465 [Gemmatimonadaceae bacterium]|nr:hypothetical protein [Gemmatimonadaceae bacterium]
MDETTVGMKQRGARRPGGVSLVALLLAGLAGLFVITGTQFALAPETLEPLGFRVAPSLGRRLLGFTMFAGIGMLVAHLAHGLWFLRRFARSYVAAGGWLGMAGCVERALNGSTNYVTLGAVGLSCAALVAYMSLPQVRTAFTAGVDGAGRSAHATPPQADG